MINITTKVELFNKLNSLGFGQRQDSLISQMVDMIPVFKHFGMNTVSNKLSESMKNTEESQRYLHYCNDFNIVVDLEEEKDRIYATAYSVANLFGCYDLADFIRNLK